MKDSKEFIESFKEAIRQKSDSSYAETLEVEKLTTKGGVNKDDGPSIKVIM